MPDKDRKPLWISLCEVLVNLQRLRIFLACLFRSVLVEIKNTKVVERLRYIRQIDFRVFLGQLCAGPQLAPAAAAVWQDGLN